MNWYVLFVKGGLENQIKNFLNDQFDDWVSFYPMVQKIHTSKGKKKVCLRPLFPSYIFVKSNIDAAEFRYRLFQIRGRMSGIIKELEYEHDAISALREDEIYYLEHLLDDNFQVLPSTGVLQEGRVHVISGPLVGLDDKIVKVNRHNRSAIIQFNILGEEKSASVALEIVDK